MPYLLLAFLSLLWGSSFLLIAVAARGFDPVSFAFVRVAIGAVALWGIALALERRWPRGAAIWARLAAMSAFGQAIPFLLLGDAARRASSGDLALMMGAAPIFAFVLSRWLGEGPRWTYASALGLALGLVGVAVCVGGPGAAAGSLLGRGEGFLAAFGYALGATLSRGASRAVGPSTSAAASMSMSALALGLGWAVSGGTLAGLAAIPAPSLEAMAALGLFNTALAYFVYFYLVVRMGATFATLNNYVVPFVGLVLGAIFLDERIALTAWIGLALVIAGIALTGSAARPGRRRAAPAPARP